MKKRHTNHKSKKFAKIALSLFIAFIMVSSIFGVLLYYSPGLASASNPVIRENGIQFRQTANTAGNIYYTAEIQDTQYEFLALPSQTSKFLADEQAKQILKSNFVLTFAPAQNYTEVIDFVRANLAYDFYQQGITMQSGIASPDTNYAILPIVTCGQATEQTPVVMIAFGSQNQIVADQNCVTATAVSPADMILLGEYIRYVRLTVV